MINLEKIKANNERLFASYMKEKELLESIEIHNEQAFIVELEESNSKENLIMSVYRLEENPFDGNYRCFDTCFIYTDIGMLHFSIYVSGLLSASMLCKIRATD